MMGGSRMISQGVRFDQITVLTVRLRIDRANSLDPDQTPQNVASGKDVRIYTVCHSSSNFTHITGSKMDLLKRRR